VNDKTKPIQVFQEEPSIILLAVMHYVRYSLSFSQIKDILHDHGIDICHEPVWCEVCSWNLKEEGRSMFELAMALGRSFRQNKWITLLLVAYC